MMPTWLLLTIAYCGPAAVLLSTIANVLRKPDAELPARGRLGAILMALADFFSVVSKPGTVGVAGAVGVPGPLGRANLPLVPSLRKRGGSGAVPPPLPPPPAAVLALVGLSLFAAGCPFVKALGSCELGKLPTSLQQGIACVASIAAAAAPGADANQAIDACVGGLGSGQGACIGEALIAWLKASVPHTGQVLPGTLRAIQVLETYLQAHPKIAACAPMKVAAHAAPVDLVVADLLVQLKERDRRPLDLAKVARDLADRYGEETAETAVLLAWRELTGGAEEDRAGDVLWLQAQPPRVRDVGWLVSSPAEWVRP